MADLLSFFKSDQAQAIFSNTQSLFMHSGEHRFVMPFIEEWKLLDNKGSTPSAFGTTYSFEIYDNGDMSGDQFLKLTVPAPTGGTDPRFCDYGGLYTIQYVNTYHGGVQVNSMTPDEILAYFLKKKRPEQIKAFQAIVGGNLSQTTRIANAASSQTFYIPILPWWARSEDPSHYLPTRFIKDKNVTRIDIVFQPYTFFLQATVGSPTITITQLQLFSSYYHLDARQRLAIGQQVATGYPIKMVDTTQKVTSEPLTLGKSSYQIKIDNLRSPISEIYFVVRPASDLQTNYGNDPTNFVTITGFSIQASGTDIIKQSVIDEENNLYILNAKKYLGYNGTKIYGYSWSWDPLMESDYYGALDLASFTNPMLTVNFASSLGADHLIDIYCIVPNMMMISSTVVKKAFN